MANHRNPLVWMIVTRKGGRRLYSNDTGRLHVYCCRKAARDTWRSMNANRRKVKVISIRFNRGVPA